MSRPVSMKRTDDEQREHMENMLVSHHDPDIASGMHMRWEEPELSKLLDDDEEIEVGDEVEFRGIARVTHVTTSHHEGEDLVRTVEVVVTKMCLEDETAEEKDEDE